MVQASLARPSARLLLGLVAALALALPTAGPSQAEAEVETGTGEATLTLVTLNGPGTAGDSTPGGELLARQDALLTAIGAAEPVYRWTTALNGFAAALTPAQVSVLDRMPGVATVEPDTIRPLAGAPTSMTRRLVARAPRLRGGAGVVIGVVDSGITPDSPVFADVPGLGRDPENFTGACADAEEWTTDSCSRKVVGAHWFVDGFGADRIRASETLSPLDALGHGTQVASVAAGNAGVTVRVDGRDAGRFGGVAPQARIAAYKACWGAPDPADDGCSTADLVTAVDQAVADGVDVLNLAVAGGIGVDTLQRATLGAAEADIVVIGAAGNTARSAYSAHSAPWVTTVGSTVGRMARGSVRIAGGPSFVGGGRPVPVRGRVVLSTEARASGASRQEARQCRPGALDARLVARRIVVCERGGIGRIDKSEAVAQARGRGMVLVNVRPGPVTADFHSVPTVHLTAPDGRTLTRWVARRPGAIVRLVRVAGPRGDRRAAVWSAAGDPRAPILKPDAVADADAVLGALPESTGRAWGLFSGSSAASAHASGLAALLRSDHDWSAATVRSMIVTSARPLPGSSVLVQGSGALDTRAPTSHLALDVRTPAWRRALRSGRTAGLNASSVILPSTRQRAVRTVTNVGSRPEYFSVTTRGFTTHRVSVRPLAVRLAPGQSARFTVTVAGPTTPGRLDDGAIVWLGARGGVTRIPVALTR